MGQALLVRRTPGREDLTDTVNVMDQPQPTKTTAGGHGLTPLGELLIVVFTVPSATHEY